MNALLLLQVAERSTNAWIGIVVPALIFLIAFTVTMLLYRHFAPSDNSDDG